VIRALGLAAVLAATVAFAEEPPAPEPSHVVVEHVLVAFSGTLPGRHVSRSAVDAEALARRILERARKGEKFAELVRESSDDQAPGIYHIANHGVRPGKGEVSRDRLVPAFGDAAFRLAPGEVALVPYDRKSSPYGWHVITRIE